jgi:signal transduction histidine kinase
VAVRVAAAPSGGISVDVRDTGTGMTPDDVARAFDRFYKGPESRGSGLGLTIARGLVVAHGGEIHASSEIGRGTTVTFTLPPA